jgi:hypothetical protein
VYPLQAIQHQIDRQLRQRLGSWSDFERVGERVRGRIRPDLAGARAREQTRQELGAVRRHLDQRLVQEMEQHVVAPDVDDEGNRRFERRDVGEVLFGSHAQVRTRPRRLLQLGNDLLKRGLVRDQVVVAERPAGFRRARNQAPELFIGQARGERPRGDLEANRQRQPEYDERRSGGNDELTAFGGDDRHGLQLEWAGTFYEDRKPYGAAAIMRVPGRLRIA